MGKLVKKLKTKTKEKFRCSCCGATCETEKDLIIHFNQEHKDLDPVCLYDMIGKFGTINHANAAYKQLRAEQQLLASQLNVANRLLSNKDNEIARLSEIVKIFEQGFNTISGVMNLTKKSIEPFEKMN